MTSKEKAQEDCSLVDLCSFPACIPSQFRLHVDEPTAARVIRDLILVRRRFQSRAEYLTSVVSACVSDSRQLEKHPIAS